ncbi:MAG TPA: 1-acyl-sn-glycerol-3-phosphate acyltransferase, partial [Nocardioides sp.]
AGVPVVPVIMWGTQRMMTKDHPRDFSRGKTISIRVGEPLHPTGDDPVAETAALKARMSQMLVEAVRDYPAAEQPPGSWWVPASMGGTAPTLEEAVVLDAEEKRERARKRAEKRAKRQGNK